MIVIWFETFHYSFFTTHLLKIHGSKDKYPALRDNKEINN